MNRNNFWIHFCIAVILIAFAAVLGQLRMWQSKPFFSQKSLVKSTAKPVAVKRLTDESEPEILVKFRSGVSLAEIKKIVAKNNDRVEDEIEAVKGLVAIDDLDNKSKKTVAEQYRLMTESVLYAEPNNEIKLDDPTTFSPSDALLRETETNANLPNDPMFKEQWALDNSGQNGGKAKADVAALKAWLKTQGSDEVVVAVLDSGVDYTHTDLIGNMWMRPDTIPAYKDDELGAFNDLHGFNAADNKGDP
ncbi:MAG: hypothetical protein H0X15_06160, partial [Acidobacteria bacterium]|nr:hypothetical protein [Acidobacteriota bacterium]